MKTKKLQLITVSLFILSISIMTIGKVLVTLKTLDIESSTEQFFNMCYFHKKQFKNKVKKIKNK